MKASKILCVLLTVVMIMSCFVTLTVGAADTLAAVDGVVTVYVDGTSASASDTNSGTQSSPKKTLDAALKAIDAVHKSTPITKGVICLSGITALDISKEPIAHSYVVEYTSTNHEDKSVYLDLFTSKQTLQLNGPAVFKNIIYYAKSTSAGIYALGHDLTMDVGCSEISGADFPGHQPIAIYGGYYSNTDYEGGNIIIKSGSYNSVRPFYNNNRGTVSGNVYIKISGEDTTVSYLDIFVIGGSSTTATVINANTVIEVDGATVKNFRVATGASSNRHYIVNGEITVKFRSIANLPAFNANTITYYSEKPGDADAKGIYFAKGLNFDLSGLRSTSVATYDQLSAKCNDMVTAVKNGSCYDIDFYGIQTTAPNSTQNIRFVASLRAFESTDTAVGFTVVATYTDPADSRKKTRTWTKTDTSVWSSILAQGEGTDIDEITAEKIGGNHIIALTIKNVPTTYGEIEFSVTPFIAGSGAANSGTARTVTLVNGVEQK